MNLIIRTQSKDKLTIIQKIPILIGENTTLRCKEDMWNIMEQVTSQLENDMNYDQDLVRRRAFLTTQFQALPAYGSAEFWSRMEEPQLKLALPLEVFEVVAVTLLPMQLRVAVRA
jgi:hypothetical protein